MEARWEQQQRRSPSILRFPFRAHSPLHINHGEVIYRDPMSHVLLDWITVADLGCWCICFWWMHRISTRQDAVLEQLREQARRIEKVSKEEHAILSEVHPNVEAIQKDVHEVTEKVDRVETRTSEAQAK